MLDLGYVREHPDAIEKMARDRGITLDLAPFREIDAERRKIILLRSPRRTTEDRPSYAVTSYGGQVRGGDDASHKFVRIAKNAECTPRTCCERGSA
jgi:hypothetical protein